MKITIFSFEVDRGAKIIDSKSCPIIVFTPFIDILQNTSIANDKLIEVSELMRKIQGEYTDDTEKKANVTYYVPELDVYVTQEMYMPDIPFTMYYADDKIIKYNSFRLAFIAY